LQGNKKTKKDETFMPKMQPALVYGLFHT